MESNRPTCPSGSAPALRYSQVVCVAGFLLTAVVVILVPLLLIEAGERTSLFWGKMFWLLCLSLFFWGALVFWLRAVAVTHDHWGLARLAPGVALGVCGYCAVSVTLLLLDSVLPNHWFPERIHLVLQIVLFVGCAITALFLGFSVLHAEKPGVGKDCIR